MNTRVKHKKEFKLVPAAMQMGVPPERPPSDAKLQDIQRKQQRAGRMVHVSATYGPVKLPNGLQTMIKTGGTTLNEGRSKAKRARREALNLKGRKS